MRCAANPQKAKHSAPHRLRRRATGSHCQTRAAAIHPRQPTQVGSAPTQAASGALNAHWLKRYRVHHPGQRNRDGRAVCARRAARLRTLSQAARLASTASPPWQPLPSPRRLTLRRPPAKARQRSDLSGQRRGYAALVKALPRPNPPNVQHPKKKRGRYAPTF